MDVGSYQGCLRLTFSSLAYPRALEFRHNHADHSQQVQMSQSLTFPGSPINTSKYILFSFFQLPYPPPQESYDTLTRVLLSNLICRAISPLHPAVQALPNAANLS